MKKLILLSAALVAAFVSHAQNGVSLEYKITSSKGPTGSIKINFSDYGSSTEFTMAVAQMPGSSMANKNLVIKSAPDVIYIINDKSKTYSELKRVETEKEDAKTYTVKKLGEETLNGHKCIHATVTDGSETQEIWTTKDISGFENYSSAYNTTKHFGSKKRELALKTAGCDGLPVKSINKGNDREGEMTQELVKFEKKNFSKSEFELPAGYTKNAGPGNPTMGSPMKSKEEIMSMTPEERAKYVEELKKQHGQ